MKHWKRKFISLCVGQAISLLTSSILQMAIIWYLTQRTASPVIITLSTLAGFLPQAVLGMFTGALIDRYSRKAILILSDLGIALSGLVLAVVAMWMELPIGLIFLILCIRSVGAAFHSPALDAIVPTIVPKEELARCAGITQSFESISMILSPALAGVLFLVWDLSSIILLDVAGAAVAIAIALCVSIPKNEWKGEGGGVRLWQETKDGIAVLKGQKGMMAVMIISALYAFIYFPIGSMYPLITMTYFGGSIEDSSHVEIIFSAGTLLGGVLLGWAGNRLHKIGAIASSIGVYGVGVLLIGLLPPEGLPIFAALSGILGLTLPFFYGLQTAIFQSKIPNEYLGRVFSLAQSASLITAMSGLMFGGILSEWIGVQYCYAICGALSICLAMSILLMPSVRNCCSD